MLSCAPTAAAALSGSVDDDGLPNPPGAVTTTWSKVSGPGSVSFGNPNQLNTSAAFSDAGTTGGVVFPPNYTIGTFTNSNSVPVFDFSRVGALLNYYNLKDFGAKCDGSTDDAAAFAAA